MTENEAYQTLLATELLTGEKFGITSEETKEGTIEDIQADYTRFRDEAETLIRSLRAEVSRSMQARSVIIGREQKALRRYDALERDYVKLMRRYTKLYNRTRGG